MQFEEDVNKVVQAILEGQLADVKRTLGQCGSGDVLNSPIFSGTNDVKGEATIHVAVHRGLLDIIDFLLEQGALVDCRTAVEKKTPLHIAALLGNVDVADRLIRFNADLHLTSNNGFTALHFAAVGGHQAMSQYLVDMGADPSRRCKAQRTPATLALQHGHEQVFAMLQGPASRPLTTPDPFQGKMFPEHLKRLTHMSDASPEGFGPLKPLYAQHDISDVPIADEDLQERFQQLDPTDRGWVLKSEFIKACQNMHCFGPPDDEKQLAKMLGPFCSFGDDRLSYEDFCVVMLHLAAR